jgi:endonuclease YncB( thermonuclease family)
MQAPHRIVNRIVVAFVLYVLAQASAQAASLYGKVIAVDDGDGLTIFNLNRPVKVKLVGIDAPEKVQPYGEIARQHLADLVLDKFVSVEYSGLGDNSYILGKVLFKDMDVGMQMLRDGVAWFDKTSSNRLSAAETRSYVDSEVAARNERRGIWQQDSPISPWDFKEQQAAKRSSASVLGPTEKRPSVARNNSSLTSDDLVKGLVGSNGVAPTAPSVSPAGEDGWRTLAPTDQHFSASVPATGFEISRMLPAGKDDFASLNVWFSDYETTSYMVMWAKGPNLNYTDSSAIDEGAKGLISGFNKGFDRRGLSLHLEASRQRDLKLDDFAGAQYTVSAGGVPGIVRVFSKQVGQLREMYLIAVLNGTAENPSVNRFLNSLSLRKR